MARNNNEQRTIALDFITNANETRSQIEQLMESIDDTSQEYQELSQSSRQLEQATENLNTALRTNNVSTERISQSINELRTQQSTATRTINSTRTAITNQSVSMRSLTSEVTSNGGAMAILDSVTGGYASTVRDSIEALGLFTTGTNGASIAQRAYTAVIGTSTGALRVFKIALAATGIGLAVVAVAALATNWERLTRWIGLSNTALTEHKNRMAEATKEVAVYDKTINRQANTLSEIAKNTKLSNAERVEAVRQLQDLLGVQNKLSDKQLQAAVNDNKVLDKIVSSSVMRLTLKEKQVKLEEENKNLLKEQADITEKLNKEPSFWEQVGALPQRAIEGITEDFRRLRNFERGRSDSEIPKPSEVVKNNLKNDLNEVNEALKQNEISLKELAGATVAADAMNRQFNETVEKQSVPQTDDYANKLKELTKTVIDLRRQYEINIAADPVSKLYKEEDVAIRNLNDTRKEQLALNNSLLKSNKVVLEQYNKIVNEYYDSEIEKSNKKIKIVKENEEEFNALMKKNSELLLSGSYNDLKEIENNIDSFIAKINDPELKNAYVEAFNAEPVRQLSSHLKQFQEDLIKYNAKLKEYQGNLTAIRDANIDSLNKEYDRTISILKNAESEALQKAIILKASEEELANIRAFYDSERVLAQEELNEKLLDNQKTFEEKQLALEKEASDKRKELRLAVSEVSASVAQAQMQLIDAGLEYASEADRERIKASAKYKDRMIALTIIDTISGAASAYTSAMGSTGNPITDQILGISSAAAVVATGMANVKKIKSVKMEGSTGGGSDVSAAGAAPNVQFVSSSENQIANSVAGAMNNANQEPIKAYVVSSDVTTAQQLEKNAISSNSL